MVIVFIAGPYRAKNNWSLTVNISRAAGVALAVWKMGAAVICPHLNCAPFQGAAPDSVWLKGDLAMLDRCDAVVALPNWTESVGARAEVARARAAGKPVFVWPNPIGLRRWIADNS